jgi:hypothetical protein
MAHTEVVSISSRTLNLICVELMSLLEHYPLTDQETGEIEALLESLTYNDETRIIIRLKEEV